MIKSLPPLDEGDVRRIRAFAAARVTKAAKQESVDNDAITILRLCEALSSLYRGGAREGEVFWEGVVLSKATVDAFNKAKLDMEARRDSHPQGAYVQPDIAYGEATVRLRNATAALCAEAVRGLTDLK